MYLNYLENNLVHLLDDDVRIPVRSDRTPVIEVIAELAVTAGKIVGLQMNTRHTVVPAGAPVTPFLRFWYTCRSFRHVVYDADTTGNSGANDGTCAVNTMIVQDLDPVVILDAKFLGIDLAHPAWLATARQRQHAQVFHVG